MILGWVIFRDGFVYEIIEGEKDFVLMRLKDWQELDTVSKFTMSDIGYPVLKQFTD